MFEDGLAILGSLLTVLCDIAWYVLGPVFTASGRWLTGGLFECPARSMSWAQIGFGVVKMAFAWAVVATVAGILIRLAS